MVIRCLKFNWLNVKKEEDKYKLTKKFNFTLKITRNRWKFININTSYRTFTKITILWWECKNPFRLIRIQLILWWINLWKNIKS